MVTPMTNSELAARTDAQLSEIMEGDDDALAVAAFAEYNRRDEQERAAYVARQRAAAAAPRSDVFGREC